MSNKDKCMSKKENRKNTWNCVKKGKLNIHNIQNIQLSKFSKIIENFSEKLMTKWNIRTIIVLYNKIKTLLSYNYVKIGIHDFDKNNS